MGAIPRGDPACTVPVSHPWNRGRGSAAAVLGAKGTGKGGDEESSSFHGLTSSDDEPVAPKASAARPAGPPPPTPPGAFLAAAPAPVPYYIGDPKRVALLAESRNATRAPGGKEGRTCEEKFLAVRRSKLNEEGTLEGPEMTIGQSRTLANRAFVMDRDCLMEGEAHTHALTRRAACVTRETLNRLSDHTGSGTPLPATQRESDIQNTQGRSFMQERNWARRAFGQLYSALISLFTTFLHRQLLQHCIGPDQSEGESDARLMMYYIAGAGSTGSQLERAQSDASDDGGASLETVFGFEATTLARLARGHSKALNFVFMDDDEDDEEDGCADGLEEIFSFDLAKVAEEPVPTEIATTIGDLSPPGDDDDAVRSPTSPAGPRKKKRIFLRTQRGTTTPQRPLVQPADTDEWDNDQWNNPQDDADYVAPALVSELPERLAAAKETADLADLMP
ncbi:hypothetical protein AK812_SmicGene16072 [Symbiodinium microadriaticum]|uniref:Uncharacterized protein n=1 Tax=Symbiodinium microadriaticum TaxID=2951 RepID=A0A1Q9E1A8_SYMMI|nr:hypothetical protein AK812_SmicGene16072 [Symbiodinium microadriaticum]